MAEASKGGGWVKAFFTTAIGLFSGAGLMYVSPLIDKVVKPSKPIANFAVQPQGLAATFQNRSTGGVEGWWDFGDGSALEPYSPGQDQIAHTYERSGVYTVKLSLRNLIGDENERTVTVNIGSQAAAGPTGPVIEALDVVPLRSETFAPATFKVSGKVKNADLCMWVLGDERPTEISNHTSTLERMVTFRRPGDHRIKLVAISGKQTVEKTHVVQVLPAPPTSVMAVVQVTHEAARVERLQKVHTIALSFPPKEPGSTHKFSVDRLAEPGFQIKQASFVNAPDAKRINKPAVGVTPDGRKAIVTGELVRGSGLLHRTAPTPNFVLQVALTQERREKLIVRPDEPMAFRLNVPGTTVIPFRKLSDDWESKSHKVTMEMREGIQTIWQNPELPKNNTVQIRGRFYRVSAVPEASQLRVEVIEAGRPASFSE